MITHVIVELDAPIEEKYWEDDDIFNNEYYGLGKPLIRCKDCKWSVKCYGDVVMLDQYGEEIHEPLGMNGYCSMGERKDK